MVANNASETSGTTIFESTIADNGTGPVTVVKMGPGSIKLDGNNTFSGGLYLLQGRVQFAGSEIGNNNPDGGGLGPIFVLPGAYLFPSGIGTAAITNNIFIAGAGDAHEPLGAVRGGTYGGTVTLIGDADFGGNAIFNGPIVGPFNLTLGSAQTVNGGATLNNPGDNWTGNTILTARTNTGANVVTSGAANVIPNGFGYGNVSMEGFSSGTITWNLNGFDQTVNGLATVSLGSTGTGSTCFIENTAAGTNCTLTIGNNDQSGTFGGVIEDAGAQLALTKIGGGIETLTGANTYSGSTIINGGALAVSGTGSIATSTNVSVNAGGTLDITGATGFSTPNPVQLLGGTLAGNGTVGALTMNIGALTLDLNPSVVNVTASSLTLGGSSNVVNISTVNEVPSYPASFTVVQYTGNLAGGMNFVIGSVPNPSTGGYISNDVSHSRIVLVLTNGPAQLTWVGSDSVNPTFWDNLVTTNWLAFKGTGQQQGSAFEAQDSVIFDDTATSSTVSLRNTGMLPAFMTFSNNTVNYTWSGPGSVGGSTTLIKYGTGSLTLQNTGLDTYRGGVALNAGSIVFASDNAISGGMGIASGTSVQVGVNAGAGTLPGGNVDDEGSLTFNRGANLTVANAISGAGAITKQDTAVLTLSGNNTFTQVLGVQAGTLRAGSGTALGATGATVSSGAALDVGGQSLTAAAVTVSGTGVGGLGAIINSGAASQNALGNVTLAGDTTFGGTNRWDIRGGSASLATSPTGSPYNLTKVGTNFVGLVGLTVDSALENIDIKQGTLDYEAGTTGLGDPNGTLTVENGATLEMYNANNALSKNIVLNGTGANDTLLCGNGVISSIAGLVTVNGTCVFDAASATTLTLNNTISGSGSVVKIGAGTNIIGGGITASYSGGTIVSNGTWTVNGTLSGAIQVFTNGILSGNGTVGGNVSASVGSIISPGDNVSSAQGTLTVGNLTLSNATVALDVSSSPTSGNDLLAAGNLTLNGTNTLLIAPLSFMNIGDTYTLITYTGATLPSSATNQLKVTSARQFFTFAVVDPSTTPGMIKIQVLAAVGNDLWTAAKSSTWDNTTTNWTRNSNPANFNDGDQVTFDDTAASSTVTITGTRNVSGIVEQAGTKAYTFNGTGGLTGVGGLDFEGTQMTFANAGSNNFTGPIYIASGVLTVGDGTTNGSIGSGALTNNGSINFNRSDTNVVANAIAGTGSLTNSGTGTLVLSGASTFAGDVTVLRGTLRVLNSAALGNTFGVTTISNGATLDITNNANLGREPIFASGAGVNGNGAIVNSSGSSTFVAANFNQLTISTNISIGGPGRLDFRASSATAQDANLNTTGGSPSLTKVGTNLLQFAGVTIDSSFGDMLVSAGTLGFQWQIPTLGDPARNLSVSNGASVAFFQMSNAVSKVLTLGNNASVLGQSGTNEFDGPVTLNGTGIFNISSGVSQLFANEISGSGSLLKTGPGILVLSLAQTNGGAEIYTGNTYVGQGTLALSDSAVLTNSPIIYMTNSTLDLSASAVGTLTLGSAIPQTLAGAGVINGTLVENSGSTVNPGRGSAPGVLTVSNAVTLNGAVLMDLKRGSGVTNDEIVAPTITVSGALTVANLGADLQNGDHFQLFSIPVSGFSAVNLPASNGSGTTTYQWRNDLALNGSITVTNVVTTGGPTTNASITKVTLSGSNLLIHGTNNNVPNNTGHFVVLTATNVSMALSNWTPVFTNTYNSDGTFDYTNAIAPGTAQQFIDVKAVP